MDNQVHTSKKQADIYQHQVWFYTSFAIQLTEKRYEERESPHLLTNEDYTEFPLLQL